jgi:FAD/FMN-containing dehydrogenase
MTTVLSKLQKHIQGDVFPYSAEKKSYATDESIFQMEPQVIVQPKHEQDVVACVEMASEFDLPITARGGGTGTAGQSIGSGIILDFSRYMNQILHLSQTSAVVQPGVVLGKFNQESMKLGVKFGPDPGSADRCTFGGMIANNAAGPHALLYGSTRDHIKNMNLVLSNGSKIESQQLASQMQSYVTEISKHADLVRAAQPKVDKNSSGYHLPALLEKPASFEKLIVGSEGTLAMVTQATVDLVPLFDQVSFAVFGFDSLGKALVAVKPLRESEACCIELLDQTILNVIKKENPALLQKLGLGKSKVSLWVEWNKPIPLEWKSEVKFSEVKQDDIRIIWGERSKVSKWLHEQSAKEHRKPLRCIEDACLPLDQLVTYVMELDDLLQRHDCKGAVFGHVGNGHLHVNPGIRADLPDLDRRIQVLMDEFYDLVIALGGTISGEHGDGILRVPYAQKQWRSIWPLFEFVKRSFDPKGIFNPDRKVPLKKHDWPSVRWNVF